ncbi:MAG: FkbM family methyltransferase [Betaproteobacteria bacterium]
MPEVLPKKLLRQWLPRDPVIVVAGAHTGHDSVELSGVWPAGHVHAFEPIPELYRQLLRNVRRRKNIATYNIALGDRSGKGRMYVSSGGSDASSSLMKPREHLRAFPDVRFETEIEVRVNTLDEWAGGTAVAQIDLLWLDMQGQELAMLKAAPRTICFVRAIYSEVSLCELYEDAPLYPEIRAWLEDRDFRVEREDLHWKEGGSVLFLRGAAPSPAKS